MRRKHHHGVRVHILRQLRRQRHALPVVRTSCSGTRILIVRLLIRNQVLISTSMQCARHSMYLHRIRGTRAHIA